MSKLKIYDARYERTFKVADYESEKFSLATAVEEGDNVAEMFDGMKTIVKNSFSGKAVGVDKTTTTSMAKGTPIAKTETTTTTLPKEDKKVEAKVEAKKEEPAKKETKVETKKETPAATTKEKKSKATKYLRANDDHRGTVGSIFDKLLPNWRDIPEAKATAKELSMSMEGEDFLDENGKILESFNEKIKEKFAKHLPDDL